MLYKQERLEMLPGMRAVVATFPRPDQADTFAHRVRRRLRLEVSSATVAAAGDPFHGHRMVVAWVPEEQVVVAVQLATQAGGVIHEPPFRQEPRGVMGRLLRRRPRGDRGQ